MDDDGFVKVQRKRSSKNNYNKTQLSTINTVNEREDFTLDISKAIKCIEIAIDDLRISNYIENVVKSVSTALQSRKVLEVVCFGLGHIGECSISRHQLALLLHLKESLNPHKVFVHDPIFHRSECQILKKLGLDIIDHNKEGSYIISDKDVTVVYLPHCPKQLTNNFLWSNWGPQLENCILVCNSFSSLIENQPSRILSSTVSYIYKIHPYISEIPLVNNFKFTDIFNDTSVHYFVENKLTLLPKDFWVKGDKPQYERNEEFITSMMIDKLNLN